MAGETALHFGSMLCVLECGERSMRLFGFSSTIAGLFDG